MLGDPIAKDGSLICEPFLAFVRRLDCWFCRASAPSQAHHWPPKGRGIVDDSRVIPVCVECHMRCHGNRVHGKSPISSGEQDVAVAMTRSLFIDRATPNEWAAYCAAKRRREDGRVFVEVPA